MVLNVLGQCGGSETLDMAQYQQNRKLSHTQAFAGLK
jgi:hypothetical protein